MTSIGKLVKMLYFHHQNVKNYNLLGLAIHKLAKQQKITDKLILHICMQTNTANQVIKVISLCIYRVI